MLALAASGCGPISHPGLWHNENACVATAQFSYSEDNEFAKFVREQAPLGASIESARKRIGGHGFFCQQGVETDGQPSANYHCRKNVLDWPPAVTRSWIAVIEFDANRAVTGYRTNCGMTGL